MEACDTTIGSIADMLPSRNQEDIIKVLLDNNFKIYRGSVGEKKINEYKELINNIKLEIDLEDSEDAIIII